MSWWQDVVSSCGHVKVEMPTECLGGNAEQVGGDMGVQMDSWGLQHPDSEPPRRGEPRRGPRPH